MAGAENTFLSSSSIVYSEWPRLLAPKKSALAVKWRQTIRCVPSSFANFQLKALVLHIQLAHNQMNPSDNTIAIQDSVPALSTHKAKLVDQVLAAISELAGIHAVILGGSMAAFVPRLDGDIDLWVLADDPLAAFQHLQRSSKTFDGLTRQYDAGFFPWFGRLLTLFFHPDCSFGIDIGFMSDEDIGNINTGAGCRILWAANRHDARLLPALQRRSFRQSPENRAERILANVVKLRKSVARRELWGSFEYLSKARRELIGIFRDDTERAAEWYERPDRELDGLLSPRQQEELKTTLCALDAQEILTCARNIIKLALRHGGVAISESLRLHLRQLLYATNNVNCLCPLQVVLVGATSDIHSIACDLNAFALPLSVLDTNQQNDAGFDHAFDTAPMESPASTTIVLCALATELATVDFISKAVRDQPLVRNVFVDLSGTCPDAARRIEAHCTSLAQGFLDAPYVAEPAHARLSRTFIGVGGDENDFNLVLPVLLSLSSSVIRIGPVGHGCASFLPISHCKELEIHALQKKAHEF